MHPKVKGFSVLIIRSGPRKDTIMKWPYCCDDMKEVNEYWFKEHANGERYVFFHKDEGDDSSIEILKRLHEEDREESAGRLRKNLARRNK